MPFFSAAGAASLTGFIERPRALGVTLLYDTPVTALQIDNGFFLSATVTHKGETQVIRGRSFVAAAGGFEANLELLKKYWGPAADNFLIRGTPFNRGDVLRMLLEKGVMAVGDPTQCHAVAIDARAPKFDGGIATRLNSIIFGIVVNKQAERFYDEGEDLWPKRYAIWGRLIAQQPGQIAYSIVDSKSFGMFMPSIFPALTAGSIGDLADKLELDPVALEKTVAEFNGLWCRAPSTTPSSTIAAPKACAFRKAIGRGDRSAAVLRLSAAARHHLHLSRREGKPGRPHGDE